MQKKPLKECRILVTPTSYGKYDKNLIIKLEELVKEVLKFKDVEYFNEKTEGLIEMSEKYHIENIVKLYGELR